MITLASGNAEDYERAIVQAEVDPGGLSSYQKDLLRNLQGESGSRGNRARAALSGESSGNSWGILGN